jgi:hypothetical protein
LESHSVKTLAKNKVLEDHNPHSLAIRDLFQQYERQFYPNNSIEYADEEVKISINPSFVKKLKAIVEAAPDQKIKRVVMRNPDSYKNKNKLFWRKIIPLSRIMDHIITSQELMFLPMLCWVLWFSSDNIAVQNASKYVVLVYLTLYSIFKLCELDKHIRRLGTFRHPHIGVFTFETVSVEINGKKVSSEMEGVVVQVSDDESFIEPGNKIVYKVLFTMDGMIKFPDKDLYYNMLTVFR